MIIKTKRVDSKHVLVLDVPEDDLSDMQKFLDQAEIYQAKRLSNGGLERIPDDEPTITFRGRDRLALPALLAYRQLCVADGCTNHQIDVLDGMIVAFQEFRTRNEDRMKQPGISRGTSNSR